MRTTDLRGRPYTPVEQIDHQIERLQRIKQGYANERRPHSVTERLADEMTDVGRSCHQIGRGACRPS